MKKGGILAIISEAYKYFGKNLKEVLLLFLQGTTLGLLYGFLISKFGLFEPKLPHEMTFFHSSLVILAVFGYLFIFVPYVINISRSILLKQKLSWDYIGSFFSRRALKIVLYSLLIGLIFAIPLLLMGFLGMTTVVASLAAGSKGTAFLGAGVLLLGVLVLLYFYLRLAVFSALISIDKNSVLGTSMKITKGKVIKFFIIILLSSLPVAAVELSGYGLEIMMRLHIEQMNTVPTHFIYSPWMQGIIVALTMLVSMIPVAAVAIFVREQGKFVLK